MFPYFLLITVVEFYYFRSSKFFLFKVFYYVFNGFVWIKFTFFQTVWEAFLFTVYSFDQLVCFRYFFPSINPNQNLHMHHLHDYFSFKFNVLHFVCYFLSIIENHQTNHLHQDFGVINKFERMFKR